MVNGDGDWAGFCPSLNWKDCCLYRGRGDHVRTGWKVGSERVCYPVAGLAVEILQDGALGCASDGQAGISPDQLSLC